MCRSYVEILLPLFLTQSIVAQLRPVTWNGGQNFQNSQNFDSVSASKYNFGVASNSFINSQQNGYNQETGFGQQSGNGRQSVYGQLDSCNHQNKNLLNELQSIPKLTFVNGQISDLISFASKVNKRQLTETNYNDPVSISPLNNPCSEVNCIDQGNNDNQINNIPINFFPNTVDQNNGNNLLTSNLRSQVNCLDQSNNNQLNVPINFFPNTNGNQNNVNNILSSNTCSQGNCIDQVIDNYQLNVPNNICPDTVLPNKEAPSYFVPNDIRGSFVSNNNVPSSIGPNTAVPIRFYPDTTCSYVPTKVLNNRVPNNIVANNDVQIISNLSPCNNGINTNSFQQNAPVPYLNLANSPRVKSLILTGEACNSGLPFSVLPANSFSAQDVTIYNDNVDNGCKITRSLPTEAGYPANNLAENNAIPVQNYITHNEAAIPLQSKLTGQMLRLNNNNNLANNVQDALNNGQPVRNNIIYNKQLISNQQPILNQWPPSVNEIQNYHNIPTASNWPAINTGSQSIGNFRPEISSNLPEIINLPDVTNYNLPDLANINMLNLGELGTLPIFSGLPVIGITETITVVDPEQLNHNLIYSYLQ